MSYVTKYTVPFKTTSNISCVVEIQEDGFTGTSTELVGGTDPFVIKLDDDDFLYVPTRFSTATLRIVGDDYLKTLFSSNYQQFRVIFKINDVVKWIGFISPEVYTQDYTSTPFELEIQCISAMSTLEQIDYSITGDSYTFISLWDTVKKCVNASKAEYSNIFIPHVYAEGYDLYRTLANVLERMTISEQNFFDEDDKAMKLKEVLESFCKLMNWTCVDWCGNLYFIDMDHSGQYYKYSSDFLTYEMVNANSLSVQDIGFSGSNHTLDILGGYSKASVKTSTYAVGTIFPTEDFDSLTHFYDLPKYTSGENISVKKFYLPSVYKLRHYNIVDSQLIEVEDITENLSNDLLGAMPIKATSYKTTDELTNYTFDEVIQVRAKNYWHQHSVYNEPILSDSNPILEFSGKLPTAAFSAGATAIKCSIKTCPSNNLAYFSDTTSINGALTTVKIKCQFSIGDKYFDNGRWSDTPSFFYLTFDAQKLRDGGFVDVNSTKMLDTPYSGLDGVLIPFPLTLSLVGEAKFTMYCMDTDDEGTSISGYFIKGLSFDYKILDTIEDSVNGNSDRIYENEVNENYINELDEIEFKMSSWNNDETAYSKVLLGENYLQNTLYCVLTDGTVRPEEQMINRIINQYSSPKTKLTQILKYSTEILPNTVLLENFSVNKKFTLTGGEIDYKEGRFEAIMVENGNN
ncbi:MAG: hypothetical protein ABFC90_07340 [Bacteroidales bacterium]|nr:hypothetical protein [Bacteroidales bacterium]